MKKIILLITIVAGLLFIAACNPQASATRKLFASREDNLSYQVVSSIEVLETLTKNENLTVEETPSADGVEVIPEIENVINTTEVEKYLTMLDQLLTSNGGFDIQEAVSDNSEYAKLLNVTTKAITGETVTYSMYYNEVSKTEEIDDDEVSTLITIQGIAVTSTNEYRLEGYLETSTEDDEVDNESFFKVIIDENNYVIVTSETETSTSTNNEYEQEFTYEVISDGKRVSKVSFELEREDNELSIKVKERENNLQSTYKFKIKERNGEQYISIEITDNDTKVNLKVRVVYDFETNEYHYYEE